MKRTLLRTAVILAIIAVIIAGALVLVRGWNSSRLDKYKRDLRAKGEKLLPSELISGPVLPNALIPRLAAANRQFGRGALQFDLMHTSSVPAWKRTNDWAAMHKVMDGSSDKLADVRDALRVPQRDFGWDQTNWSNFSSKPLIEVRTAAHWLRAAVIIELNRGRTAEAVTNLLSLLDLVHCHEYETSLVAQMIRVTLATIAYEASWETLQASGWTDDHLAQVQASWRRVSLLTPLELALQMERARGLEYFVLARGGKSDEPVLDQTPESLSDAFYAPLWNVALSAGDERQFIQSIQEFLDALRAVRTNSSGAELQKRLGPVTQPGWFAKFRYPMARVLMPNIRKALDREIKTEVQLQLVIAAIGLERYRLRHGRYPEKLEQLVPDILPTVPIDFGDGQPLRYKRVGEQYEIWSVWEDMRWPRAKSGEGE